jgi:hypothetical protein
MSETESYSFSDGERGNSPTEVGCSGSSDGLRYGARLQYGTVTLESYEEERNNLVIFSRTARTKPIVDLQKNKPRGP